MNDVYVFWNLQNVLSMWIFCSQQCCELFLLWYLDNFFVVVYDGWLCFWFFLLQEVFGSTCIFIALHRSMLRLERLVLITYNVLYYSGIIFLTLTTIYYIDLLWFLIYYCWHLLHMLVMKFCSQHGSYLQLDDAFS